MKTYLILADIGEEMPCFTFMLKAKTIREAENKALEIVKENYGDNIYDKNPPIYPKEVKTIDDIYNTLGE